MEKRLERMPAAAQTSIRHRSAGRRNDDRMSDARCSAVRHCKGRAPHHRIGEHARLLHHVVGSWSMGIAMLVIRCKSPTGRTHAGGRGWCSPP